MKEIEDMVNKYIRASLKGIDLSDDFFKFFCGSFTDTARILRKVIQYYGRVLLRQIQSGNCRTKIPCVKKRI